MTASKDLEIQVETAVRAGRTADAVALLYNAILEIAKQGDFERAEVLRDRLFQVDDMAINEIVKSGEAIETAKSRSMDPTYRDLWPELIKLLDVEEANALFYDARKLVLDTDQVVFRQNQFAHKLILLYSGRVNIICLSDQTETFITAEKPGAIIGQDIFFGFTGCTYAVRTASPTTLFVVDPEVLDKWKTKAPNLANKLKDYCSKLDSISTLVDKKGVNRRQAKRVKMEGVVDFQLLNQKGEILPQVFRAELDDMSNSGAALIVRTPNQETLRVLLGRRIVVRIPIKTARLAKQVRLEGMIKGISPMGFSEYSIHIQFDKTMNNNQFEILSRALAASHSSSKNI